MCGDKKLNSGRSISNDRNDSDEKIVSSTTPSTTSNSKSTSPSRLALTPLLVPVSTLSILLNRRVLS